MKATSGYPPLLFNPRRITFRLFLHTFFWLQTPDGDWAQEGVSGIFNRTCSITYANYRNIFPLWALAAYQHE